MTKLFLKEIAFMVAMVAFGVLGLCTAAFSPTGWPAAFGLDTALFAFYIAWLCYKAARRAAELIDVSSSLTLITILNGKENEDNGQEQGEAKGAVQNEVQPRTGREDESEDNCAHPI